MELRHWVEVQLLKPTNASNAEWPQSLSLLFSPECLEGICALLLITNPSEEPLSCLCLSPGNLQLSDIFNKQHQHSIILMLSHVKPPSE